MNRSAKVLLLCFGWSLVLTFPLVLNFGTAIPLGSEHSTTVPNFNLWTLQWNIEQVLRGFPNYWNAPIFAPTTGAFAFSEPEPVTAFLAMPLWLFGGAAAGYNSVILLFLTLNGWFAFALLRGWHLSVPTAIGGALIMQSLPFVAQEMGVLQLTAIFGILWILFFLQQFLKFPTPAHGIGLAVGIPIVFLTCGYYGLFSLIFVPPAIWAFSKGNIHLWGKLAGFIFAGMLLAAPPVLVQRQILTEHSFTRSEATIRQNSATPEDYLKTLDTNIFYKQLLHRPPEKGQRLFPGWMLLALAAIGAVVPAKHVSRRVRWYLLGTIVLAYLLSLGFHLSVWGWEPYQMWRRFFPGMEELRSPFRFAVMGQIALALLAGIGLEAVLQLPNFSRPIALVLTIAAVAESLALPLPLHAIPPIDTHQPWQQWINRRSGTPTIVLLPFAKNGSTAAFEQTTRWMLENASLDAVMLNGYSGFFPPAHGFLRAEMTTFPAVEAIHLLQKFHTDYVVVFHSFPGAPPADTVAGYLPPVYFDSQNRVSIFEMPP